MSLKHIFLNLKRFDIPAEYFGVNKISPIRDWGGYIASKTEELLRKYANSDVEFVQFYPEAHIIPALNALHEHSHIKVGCQGVYRLNASGGGNFGAFTTNRAAGAMAAMGCMHTIIGHCEERSDKSGILAEAGIKDSSAINRLLNQEITQAVHSKMNVLYCIGEKSEEQEQWQAVLGEQIDIGLLGVERGRIVIAYEPVWSIGPGKTPADKGYIEK